MPKRPLPEIILALTTGCGRGTAIYGDLMELAATRGRAWFWMAYARTVFSLTWRTVAGFLAGVMSLSLLLSFFQLWDSLTHDAHRTAAGFVMVLIAMGLLPSALVITLLLLAPYTIVRYGLRDRMALLAGAILVIDTAAFLYDSRTVICIAPLAILVAALCIKSWRRPTAVFAATVVVSAAIFAGLHVEAMGDAGLGVAMLLIAVVCSTLRRWLLQSRREFAVN